MTKKLQRRNEILRQYMFFKYDHQEPFNSTLHPQNGVFVLEFSVNEENNNYTNDTQELRVLNFNLISTRS